MIRPSSWFSLFRASSSSQGPKTSERGSWWFRALKETHGSLVFTARSHTQSENTRLTCRLRRAAHLFQRHFEGDESSPVKSFPHSFVIQPPARRRHRSVLCSVVYYSSLIDLQCLNRQSETGRNTQHVKYPNKTRYWELHSTQTDIITLQSFSRSVSAGFCCQVMKLCH